MYSWLKTAGQYYMALFRKAITLICFLWLKSGKLLSFLLSCTCLMRDGSSFPSPHKARITIPNLGLPFHIQRVCENIYNKYIYSPICCIWSLVSPKNLFKLFRRIFKTWLFQFLWDKKRWNPQNRLQFYIYFFNFKKYLTLHCFNI